MRPQQSLQDQTQTSSLHKRPQRGSCRFSSGARARFLLCCARGSGRREKCGRSYWCIYPNSYSVVIGSAFTASTPSSGSTTISTRTGTTTSTRCSRARRRTRRGVSGCSAGDRGKEHQTALRLQEDLQEAPKRPDLQRRYDGKATAAWTLTVLPLPHQRLQEHAAAGRTVI